MLRAKNQIIHPVSSAERAVFRSVDRAITPRRSRKRQVATIAKPATVQVRVENLEKLSASVNQLGVNSRAMAEALLNAQMANASPEQRARWMPVIEAQRAGARIEFSPEGHVTGWWTDDIFHPFPAPQS